MSLPDKLPLKYLTIPHLKIANLNAAHAMPPNNNHAKKLQRLETSLSLETLESLNQFIHLDQADHKLPVMEKEKRLQLVLQPIAEHLELPPVGRSVLTFQALLLVLEVLFMKLLFQQLLFQVEELQLKSVDSKHFR